MLTFPSRKSQLIAVSTLAPLILVGWAIYAAGQRDRTEAVDLETDPTVFGDGKHALGASHAAHGAATPPAPNPAGSQALDTWIAPLYALDGLTWPDRGTPYTRATLWNRIDGGAELYREHGLRRALFATARVGEDDLEVQLFELKSQEQAGALWAKATNDAKLPRLLWEGGGEVLKDTLYGRVVASTAGPSDTPKRLLDALAGVKTEPDLPDAIPGIEGATRQDTWAGRDFLGPALVGEAPDESEVFLTRPADPEAALKTLAEQLGAPVEDGVVSGKDPYQGDVIAATRGPYLGGIAGFEDRDAARARLHSFLADLFGPN